MLFIFHTKKVVSQVQCMYAKFRRAGVSASATVEASLVLSFILFVFLALYTPFFTMHTQMNVQAILEQSCWEMAVFTHADKANMTYEKLKILEKKQEIKFIGNDWVLEDGMVDIAVSYNVKIPFFPMIEQKFVQRARRRAWVGKDGLDSKNKEDEEIVYLAQNGSVYHLYSDCSHIKLSIKTVNSSQISGIRNSNGGKYHPCERCKPSLTGSVYITSDGDRYHSVSNCSGIKRSVKEVHKSDVQGMNVCKRCSARKGREG